MQAEKLDTGRAHKTPGCMGAACVKRQAGECKHATAGEIASESPEQETIPVPRVERRSKLRQLLLQERGQSLVEFALTLPVLLLAVTGISAFGLAFNNYMMLTEATQIGARQLTVSRGQTTDPCKTTSNAVYAASPLLKQANLTFSITLNGTAYPGTTCSGTTTSGAPSNMVLGTNAIVTVTYPVSVTVYGMKVIPGGTLMTATTTELMQ